MLLLRGTRKELGGVPVRGGVELRARRGVNVSSLIADSRIIKFVPVIYSGAQESVVLPLARARNVASLSRIPKSALSGCGV